MEYIYTLTRKKAVKCIGIDLCCAVAEDNDGLVLLHVVGLFMVLGCAKGYSTYFRAASYVRHVAEGSAERRL